MDTSASFVADYYCVSHISAATILGSRLSNILTRMHQGRPLTQYTLDFLRQQGSSWPVSTGLRGDHL